MLDKEWRIVLGAPDPEMREIEQVLRDDDRLFVHAACARQRCIPRDAYDADGVLTPVTGKPGRPAVLLPKEPVVYVECSVLGHDPVDASKKVRAHYDSEFGESRFPDPTEIPPHLAEGSAYAGIPVRYRALLPDATIKEMFKGGTPAAVHAFMAEHRGKGRQVHGNPYRGYAGAYWSP